MRIAKKFFAKEFHRKALSRLIRGNLTGKDFSYFPRWKARSKSEKLLAMKCSMKALGELFVIFENPSNSLEFSISFVFSKFYHTLNCIKHLSVI